MKRIVSLARTEGPRSWPELRAFLLGVREFRLMTTTNPGEEVMHAYDFGRELAHFLTLRHWDH